MKKLVILFAVVLLVLGLIASAIGCKPEPEREPTPDVQTPVPVEEGILMEMHTRTTMAGVGRHLTISADGTIVYFDDRGLRHPTEENPPIRTTKTGQLTEAELNSLLEMVDACPFDAERNCDAHTEIIDTDAVSVLTVYYQGTTRTITANYQPLFHPEIPKLTDVPEPVRKLYRQLKSIINNNTSQISEEPISQTDEAETHTPVSVKDTGRLWAEEEAPDDVIPVPGMGPAYRANVHAQGEESPWAPIEVSSTFLGNGFDEARISYRSHIETAAGDTRHNIIRATIPGEDFNSVNSLTLYADDVPQGITLTDGEQWGGPRSRASVLVIEIAQNVAPGEYPLEIGLEINGKDYGTVLCKIEVTGSTTPNNGGMTSIIVQPEPGQYLVYDNQESDGVILKAVTIKSDVCDRDYMDLQGHATVRKGEPCLLVTGQVESQLDHDKYMTLSARGYDVSGKEVTYVLDAGPIWGVISIFIPAKGINEFVLHLKTAPDIVKIELMPSPELYDIPPP